MIHGFLIFMYYYILVGFSLTVISHTIFYIDELIVRNRRNGHLTIKDYIESYNHFLIKPNNIFKLCFLLTVAYPVLIIRAIIYFTEIADIERKYRIQQEAELLNKKDTI